MSPIALTNSELQEVLQAARLVPHDLRQAYLEQVAVKLRGKDLGPGLVHRVAFKGRARYRMGQRARGSNPAGGVTMILVERYLLPPGRTEEERLAIVRERVRKRHGVSGRVIAVFPGEDG